MIYTIAQKNGYLTVEKCKAMLKELNLMLVLAKGPSVLKEMCDRISDCNQCMFENSCPNNEFLPSAENLKKSIEIVQKEMDELIAIEQKTNAQLSKPKPYSPFDIHGRVEFEECDLNLYAKDANGNFVKLDRISEKEEEK